eukprot:5570304-Pyramimonas_sp.AAC.1
MKCPVVVASPIGLAGGIGANLKSLDSKVCSKVKSPGRDFSQQIRAGRRVPKSRVQSLRRRPRRFRAPRRPKAGLSRVFRAGGLASATYGV